MQFGDKLRALRQDSKLTQPDLAERLGVEQSWLSKIENNKCLPSGEFLQQVLDTFALSLQSLLQDLDRDYVRSQLSVIPAVKKTLQVETRQQFHIRKNWIIGSSIACVFGAVLLCAGFLNLLFPATMIEYTSDGVIYPGEPMDLYSDTRQIPGRLGLIDIPEELANDYARDGTKTGRLNNYIAIELGRFEQTILARRDESVYITFIDTGFSKTETVEVEAGQGIVDIFGKRPQTGLRLYYESERFGPNYANSILLLIGFLLFIGGLFGFLTDYRLAKLSK